MKNKLTLALLAALGASLTSGYAVTINTDQGANSRITFVDSDSYTDAALDPTSGEKDRNYVLGIIEEAFAKTAQKSLPDGHKLVVEVKDVDLAGDFLEAEARGEDYRTLRSIYPPRITFDYTVLDANENLVASGSESLVDMHYLNRVRIITTNETAYYTVELIRDWGRNLKKAAK